MLQAKPKYLHPCRQITRLQCEAQLTFCIGLQTRKDVYTVVRINAYNSFNLFY